MSGLIGPQPVDHEVIEMVPEVTPDLLLVLSAGHLRHVDDLFLPHAYDLILEVGVDDLAMLLVEELHQPAESQAQVLKTVQIDPLPETGFLYGSQVSELCLHCGDRALLFEQHGDLDHSLPATLVIAYVALDQGKLHAPEL